MTLKHLLHKPAALMQTTPPLTGLDLTFAQWLHTQHPAPNDAALWLAALTSHQWGRGHACLDVPMLMAQPAALLGWTTAQVQLMPTGVAQTANDLPWTQGENSPLVYDAAHGLLYLRRAWQAEQFIRNNIAQRLQQPQPVPNDVTQRLDDLFPNSTQAHDLQRRACEVAAHNAVTLITGGPGTGKTTTVVRLLALLAGNQSEPLRIHLAAPTGKAAARLSESITQAMHQLPAALQARIPTQAQTLHRLLQAHTTNTRVTPLASDVVVVDEASMIDLEMMARLLQAVPLQARLVLLGDKDQLASVEAGAVMSQLCSGTLLSSQTVTLTHSHRFDANRGIGRWAQAVNHAPEDVPALWQQTPDWLDNLSNHPMPDVTRLTHPRPQDPTWFAGVRHGWHEYLTHLQNVSQGCDAVHARSVLKAFAKFSVLCALREGPWGVAQLNPHIEKALQLNPHGRAWYVGRPVMVTRNDYALDLMNGDIGVCLPNPEGELRVAFPSSDPTRVRWIAPSRLDSVDTVFAMTVHKSQGSEFTHVLLVVPAQNAPVLTRELLYTGLTRARERLTVWAAQSDVLFNACQQRVLRSGGLAQ